MQWESLTGIRVRIEGIAVGLKALATLATVRAGGEGWALLAFGVGQVAYGATLLIGLGVTVGRKSARWTLTKVPSVDDGERLIAFDPNLITVAWALTKQSLVKQLLTEGDKVVVGQLSKVEDQGGYAVALNYGSLVARILFQPLEESSRLFFSRNLSAPTSASIKSSVSLLSTLLLLYTHLSLIFVCFCPSFTSPLLFHLLGQRWSNSSAPKILRAYCLYLPFLAINGITEAFFQSVASPLWIKRGSYWMGLCSGVFIGAVALGVAAGMDETGLIYANCVNMTMRIIFSSFFIRQYFPQALQESKASPLDQQVVAIDLSPYSWMPKTLTGLTFAVARFAVRWSEQAYDWRTLKGLENHGTVGALSGILCLAVM
ncbi:hypothetical protein T439DRAFT_286985 [Meredithblackwellia eburnea MCA 4105]